MSREERESIDSYAAGWFAEKLADESRCPILFAVEVMSIERAGYRLPSVEVLIEGTRRPSQRNEIP